MPKTAVKPAPAASPQSKSRLHSAHPATTIQIPAGARAGTGAKVRRSAANPGRTAATTAGGFAKAMAKGLHAAAYRGDGCVLLAFNFEAQPAKDFQGFAIECTPPNGQAFWLKNRLTFGKGVVAQTTPKERASQMLGSNQAPFQKFRWVDFSSSRGPGAYTYRVCAMYGSPGKLESRQEVSLQLHLGKFQRGDLEVGFTRGFLSSQAYVDKFQNKELRPQPKSLTYDPKPFEAQYQWLGFHARELIYGFLDDCLADPTCTLDVLAYDLDELAILNRLLAFGPRLRAVLDDAPLHVKDGALEVQARKQLIQSAGANHIVCGHFKRFAHCKVLIKRDKHGQAVRALTGSTNFSVRGLYVQANNVLVFNDAATAALYGQAFDESFHGMAHFSTSEIAEGWIDLPDHSLAFSPHRDAADSLDRVAKAIQGARHSVFFALMELGGTGPVLEAIRQLNKTNPDVLTYGVTQNLAGTSLYKPGSSTAEVTPFAYLAQHVPAPFSQEISGGPGQVIHDKYLVLDFDTDSPRLYTGSSNLAAGGEEANGDSLIEIRDPEVVRLYAVNAVGLFDHFHFRAVQKTATAAAPLVLDSHGKWFLDYFQAGSIHSNDRELFCP